MIHGMVKIIIFDGKKESIRLVKIDKSNDAVTFDSVFHILVQDNKKKVNHGIAMDKL